MNAERFIAITPVSPRRLSMVPLWIAACALGGCVTPRSAPAPSMPETVFVRSPHYRSGPRQVGDVLAIVIHTTEGSYDESRSFEENQERIYRGTVRYFEENDREVSAHFVIGPDGCITQMVDEADIAHTQTYYNARSIGIECAGWSSRAETWTPALLNSLVDLTVYLAAKWDVPPEHPEGTAESGPHASVDAERQSRFSGEGLVGHFQIQPWNRTDPGPHFPWDWFVREVQTRSGGWRRAP